MEDNTLDDTESIAVGIILKLFYGIISRRVDLKMKEVMHDSNYKVCCVQS